MAAARGCTGRHAGLKVLALYPHTDDLAHVSFIGEANSVVSELARTHGFSHDATDD
jgi:hypothetical protein